MYEDTSSKEGMIGIIEGLGALPEEYVVGAGLKSITLYDGQKAKWGGLALQAAGEIALPVGGGGISPRNVKHEVAHLFDYVSCGGSFVDPQINAVGNSTIDSGDIRVINQPSYQQRSAAFEAQDIPEICRITREINENDRLIGAFTSYNTGRDGKASRAENIAEGITSFGTSTNYNNVLAPDRSPRLKKLTSLLYARLGKMSPPVAEFFAGITPHLASEDQITNACDTGDWQQLFDGVGDK
jgi:hypothetical protein